MKIHLAIATGLITAAAGMGAAQSAESIFPACAGLQAEAMTECLNKVQAMKADLYKRLDKDGNGLLDSSEGQPLIIETRMVALWDTDADNMLSDEEFYGSILARWDQNADGQISLTEYEEMSPLWTASDGDARTFEAWDANGDGQLAVDEFRVAIVHWKTFPTWDTDGDGLINDEEFAVGTMRMWDADGDGVVANEEIRQGIDRM